VTWGIVQWIPLWGDQMTHGQATQVKGLHPLVSSAGAVLGCLMARCSGANSAGAQSILAVPGVPCWLVRSCSRIFRIRGAFLAPLGSSGVHGGIYGWLPQYLPSFFPTPVAGEPARAWPFNFGRVLAALGALQMSPLWMTFFTKATPGQARPSSVYRWHGPHLLAPETKGRPLPP